MTHTTKDFSFFVIAIWLLGLTAFLGLIALTWIIQFFRQSFQRLLRWQSGDLIPVIPTTMRKASVENGKPLDQVYFEKPHRDHFKLKIIPTHIRTALCEKAFDCDKTVEHFARTRYHCVGLDKNVRCAQFWDGSKWDGECASCNYYKLLHAKDFRTKNIDNIVRRLKPYEWFLYNVVSGYSHESISQPNSPRIWQCSRHVHNQIQELYEDRIDESENVFSLMHGRDFIIDIEKIDFGPGFKKHVVNLSESIGRAGDNKEIEFWMANRYDLEQFAIDTAISYQESLEHLNKFLKKDPSYLAEGIKQCRICNVPFRPNPSLIPQPKFCSDNCSRQNRDPHVYGIDVNPIMQDATNCC